VSINNDMGMQGAVRTENNMLANDAVRPDGTAGGDAGVCVNNGSGMNGEHELQIAD
jgi:hypothetical protein